jgi:hypothetical protein
MPAVEWQEDKHEHSLSLRQAARDEDRHGCSGRRRRAVDQTSSSIRHTRSMAETFEFLLLKEEVE